MAQSVQPNQIEDILTLTPTQEGILYHCLKDSVQQMYVGQVALEVTGQLHVSHLEKALQRVVQENECLRSVFRWEKLSHPVQVILRQMSHHIMEHDLTSLSEQEQKEQIVQMDEEERSKGFDLTKGPLLRISASKVRADQYRVLINFHHIMMDGWSLGVFLSEWFTRYGQLQSNQVKKSQPKTKYKEYVKWLGQQETGKAKGFWNRVLQSWEPTTKLPYRHDKNETHLHMNSVVTSLSDIMPEVSHFSKTYGVTPNTILNVAWGVMLQRYSGSDDVTFGLTVSGRPDEMQGVDQTIGLFINTVPVRVMTESKQTVTELMSEVHKQAVEMKEYEYLPLTDIHSAAKLRGNESLFDHILVFENYPLDQKLLEGAYHDFQITRYSEWELNNYDLTVAFLLAGEPQMKFDYMDGLFDRQTMERMAEHFQVVLRQIISRPDELVRNLDILPKWEEQLTLFQFNQTEQAFPQDKTVYQLFVEQVKASPSMNAVVFQDESITYEQLFERVQRLGGRLQRYGIVPGDVVSIQLDWSIDMVVAIMGVLGTGAAYVPIDPHYPSERIEYILQDSRSQLLITSTECKGASSEMMSHVLVLDSEESDDPHAELELMPVDSSPSDLAYVIYTSGSTGRPKGVMIEQESFVEFVTWAVKEYEHRLGYQVLLSNSFAFDSSIQQIFPPLVSGGTLHLLHPDVRKDARQYLDYLKQHRINNIDEIPVIMNVLIEQIDESEELPLLPDLTCLSLGSEYVPIELVKNCRTYLNRDGRIINGYGPAEASVETCTYHFDGNSEHEISLVGRPRDNTRVYILDQHGRLCPIGISGEICVSGVGLARGYLYQPELTNEKFIANSFSGILGDRLYKTGDAGRWLADGNVEYVGRIDNQVKIRGFRVELGEIENVLLKHPEVSDAIVIARKNGSGDTDVYAFLKAESKLAKHDVNTFLADKLPHYMIPTYYEYVESYPLTPNGKVDRKALAQMEVLVAVEEQDGSSSRHELDEQIMAVWKEVLDLGNVGIYTNFFEAGGNSIQIMRAFNKLKKVLPDLSLEISDLFTYNTIASLADFVTQSAEASKEEPSSIVEEREELAESVEAETTRDIAIIGISAKVPGADDVDEWWELLREGKCSIQEIPESRIKLDPGQSPAKQYLRYGYIEGIDQFDPQYFNISPKLAKEMDPNQRMMLETVNQAIEDAGYPREKIANQNVGVFMGSVMPSYMNHVDVKVDELLASNLPANLAGRISYHFGLNGPSMVIDTACSSSLVALHSAINALRYGECEMALVGGVHIEIDHIRKEIAMGSGIVSPTETCRAFSDDADGTIGGEGSICLLIKPLEKAVADQDHIYGVIKGSAIVQDGARSNGMTAPSPDAQAETIVRAWQDAKIDPMTISYIEAHGTGTKLGDPIEVKGIRKAYESYTDQKQFIAMGSVKTNMGHLDSAAGLAGLVKAVLSLQNGMIPPSLHYTKPNAFIDFESSPVYLNTSLQPWEKPEGYPRRAGISSFGLSGTNVHVVVEEYGQPKTASDQVHLVTLSAPTEKVLHGKIRDLKRDLAKNREYELADISYTLNCRRNHDSYRFSTVVRDIEELSKALEDMQGIAEKPVKRLKKVVLWIPDYEVGMESLWEALSQTGWIDESITMKHQQLLDHAQDPKAKVVAFASSVYHLLRKLGLEVGIEGSGIGIVARDFILGTISFTDVLQGTSEKNQTMADVVSKFGEETLVLSVGSCTIKDVSAVGYDVEVRDLFTLEKKEHDFLSVLSHLYQMGYNLHFEAIQQGRTVSLPTYPFQRKSYWFEQSKKQKSGSSLFNQDHTESIKVKEELMHTFEWAVSELPANLSARGVQGAILIITDLDNGTTYSSLIEKFTDHGHQVIQLHYGRKYRSVADDQVEINPREEEHFTRMMKELRESGVSIGAVIDLSRFQSTSLANVSRWNDEQLDTNLVTSLHPTLNLVKSIAALSTKHPVYTFFITQQAYSVGVNDHYVNPLHSPTLALSRTMNRELNQVQSFCIDMNEVPSDQMAQMIYEEVSRNNVIREVAYRSGKRYTKTLKRMPIGSMTKREMIRESGVYLVTGGTGGIAQEICQSIAKKDNVILILVGRTSEQDVSSQQAESMDTIRGLGSEVHYYQADVANLTEMNSVLDDVTAQFGKVDGVIHTAGVLGKPVSLKDSKLEDYKAVMEAKVKGTLVLDQLLKEQFVDFFLVFSSVDAVLSEKRIAPYACANAFLDSYASLQRQMGKRFISIQWGGWQNTGMGDVQRAKEDHASVDKIKRLSPLILGFNRNDGVAAFHAILGANVSPAFVSGLNQEDMEEIRGLSFFEIDSQLLETKLETSQSQASWTFEQIVEAVTKTWREILEFEEDEELDPGESYFSLGGDSIQGIDIMVELSNLFSLKMDADTIFRFDSVKALSQHIFDSLQKPKTAQKIRSIPKARPIQ
ncbi:hybrid non-ribosomal peptide synthetase/type I polyketide synthase [Thermoactinomyces sp. DSM 45892]|uniref:hybrid non-ribosomal peptide synthetase/type I polyketide synthase n=1 Tax=Thermoactinomyces sp. DSM 45892 TaxID=1882753 RepID=UPI000899101D|nr:non-ribosomal peptide synthetase [Thermoactinomyces sp. DSM 45892]SDY17711.1 amino acid adenylation domain-containing protein [Thermoactinomyces sp. DSM 45892]